MLGCIRLSIPSNSGHKVRPQQSAEAARGHLKCRGWMRHMSSSNVGCFSRPVAFEMHPILRSTKHHAPYHRDLETMKTSLRTFLLSWLVLVFNFRLCSEPKELKMVCQKDSNCRSLSSPRLQRPSEAPPRPDGTVVLHSMEEAAGLGAVARPRRRDSPR